MMTFEEYFVQLQGFLTSINARSGRASVGYFEQMDLGEYAEDLENIHLKLLEDLIEKITSNSSPEGIDIFKSECLILKSKIIEYTKWLKDRGITYDEDIANKAEMLADELSEAVDLVSKAGMPKDQWDLGPLGGGHPSDIGGWGGVGQKPASAMPFPKEDEKGE
jgi:hypothetical protein